MPIAQLTGFGAFRGMLTFRWAPDPLIVASDMDKAAAHVENMQPPLQASRQVAQAEVRESFESETSPAGDFWPSLSEGYQRATGKPARGDILKDTMDLMGSATSAAAFPITARELFFDFSVLPFYGIFHQEGAADRVSGGRGRSRADTLKERKTAASFGIEDFGANPLPARPFAGIDEEAQFKIIDIFDNWFAGAIGFAVGSGGTVQARLPSGQFGPKIA